MRWTYTELDEQPADKVELTLAFINAERKQQEREQKRRARKGGAVR